MSSSSVHLGEPLDSPSSAEPWKDALDADEFAKLVRVGDTDLMVEFCTRFWGKSMEEEEREWRLNQKRTEDDHEDAHRDAMDVVEDQQKFDKNDIGKGCYGLDIEIVGFLKSLWIRADYIRIYDYLLTYERECKRYQYRGGILTGQPGSGKSVWLIYALRRRLAEKKPTIWYYTNGSSYLFLAGRVYQLPPGFYYNSFKRGVWALVDADTSSGGAPCALTRIGVLLFLVYASSPDKARWKSFTKTRMTAQIIMNPWSKEEIHQAVALHLAEDVDRAAVYKRVDEVFEQYGPIPRLCIDFALKNPNQLTWHERELNGDIKKMSVEFLTELVRGRSELLSMDDVANSESVCLMERTNRSDLCGAYVVKPITHYVGSKLATQLTTLRRRDQVELIKLCLSMST